MIEIWKDVPGYEGRYQVSNLGNVKSLPKEKKGTLGGSYVTAEKILSAATVNGYKKALLYKDGKRIFHSVHRLVAIAFLDNQLAEVNHINGVKTDNRVENLEWCSSQQNVIHSHKNNLIKNKVRNEKTRQLISDIKKKKIINTETGKIYNSISEAAQELKVSLSGLSMKLNGISPNNTKLKLL